MWHNPIMIMNFFKRTLYTLASATCLMSSSVHGIESDVPFGSPERLREEPEDVIRREVGKCMDSVDVIREEVVKWGKSAEVITKEAVKYVGRERPDLLYMVYDTVGRLGREAGYTPAALYAACRALTCSLEQLVGEDPAIVYIYTAAGDFYRKERQPALAKTYYEKALELLSYYSCLDVRHKELYASLLYKRLAQVADQQGDIESATRHIETSIRLLEELAKASPLTKDALRRLAMNLRIRGLIAHKSDDLDTALAYYLRGLELQKQAFGESQEDLVYTYLVLGEVYRLKGMDKEAADCFEKARAIQLQQLGLQPQNQPLAG